MKTLAFLAAALALAACGTPVRQEFYTLGGAATPIAATAGSLSVFVGPVSIPEEVDRSPMVLRTGPNTVEILDSARWAEPLKSAIPRVVAEGLMRELNTPRVFASRQGATQAVDFRVAVELRRFESSRETGASIDAVWTVTNTKGGGTRSGRTVASEPAGGDLQALAAAHTRLLGRLAAEIAAGLRAAR